LTSNIFSNTDIPNNDPLNWHFDKLEDLQDIVKCNLEGKSSEKKADENDCRNALLPICYCLLNNGETFVQSQGELFSKYGKSDLIIRCSYEEGKKKKDRVYVWECKSPKSDIFKYIGLRAGPSSALVEAENQLLHYFRAIITEGDVPYSAFDIKWGGIIIGMDREWEVDVEEKNDFSKKYKRKIFLFPRSRKF